MQNFTADDLHRTTVYDRDGQKVGQVQQVYLDDDSGRPSWVTVNTGLFGTNESLIPLDGAHVKDDVLEVPFEKQVIKDAPNFDPGHHMDESDEDALYDYYGVGSGHAHDNRADLDRDRGDRTDPDRDRGDRTDPDRDRGDRTDPERSDRTAHDRDRDRDRDDRTIADRAMDRPGDDRGHDDGRAHDQDRDFGNREDLRDRSAGETQGRGGTPGAATAAGAGGLAAAAAAGGRPDSQDDRDDRDGARPGQAGDAFASGTDTRAAQTGGLTQSGSSDADQGDDDLDRDMLDRERELLQRERELLDKERQLMEREQQRGGRPRLRRHDPGQH